MRILFDHNAPAPLIPYLEGHLVTTARRAGWDRLADRDLLDAAEREGYEIFLTGDRRIATQQNLLGRKIAIIVLTASRWPVVQRYVRRIAAAVNIATPGSFTEVEIPFR